MGTGEESAVSNSFNEKRKANITQEQNEYLEAKNRLDSERDSLLVKIDADEEDKLGKILSYRYNKIRELEEQKQAEKSQAIKSLTYLQEMEALEKQLDSAREKKDTTLYQDLYAKRRELQAEYVEEVRNIEKRTTQELKEEKDKSRACYRKQVKGVKEKAKERRRTVRDAHAQGKKEIQVYKTKKVGALRWLFRVKNEEEKAKLASASATGLATKLAHDREREAKIACANGDKQACERMGALEDIRMQTAHYHKVNVNNILGDGANSIPQAKDSTPFKDSCAN